VLIGDYSAKKNSSAIVHPIQKKIQGTAMAIGIRTTIGIILAVLMVGCAHPIKVAPDIARLQRVSSTPPRVAANVGYYIPKEVRTVEITTQGGGGDNVRYYPYDDIEPGFEQILSNTFNGVLKLTSLDDLPSIARGGTEYIIQPVLVTTSGGSGLFTWPPTNFTVDLTCNIRDSSGKLFASPRVVGTGSAETGERLRDHGLAGKRAMEDALIKMQAAILETWFANTVTDSYPTKTTSNTTIGDADRLARLKDLRDKGLISKEEYEAKRKAIVDTL
jgi:hypothetical protein